MKLQGFKRLYKGDFDPEDQPLVEELSVPFNSNIEPLYEAINGRLTFGDNIKGVLKVIQVELNSSGIPISPVGFLASSTDRIVGCQVVKAENLTNSTTYPTATPFISYSQVDNRITVNHIAGLPANNVFRLTVKVEG